MDKPNAALSFLHVIAVGWGKTGGGMLASRFLSGLSAIEYLEAVRQDGRGKLASSIREMAAHAYQIADALLVHETSMRHEERILCRFIHDVFAAERMLLDEPTPRYVAYTNMRVLDRYLLEGEGASASKRRTASRRALGVILTRWRKLEHERLSHYSSNSTASELLGYEDQSNKPNPVAHLRDREKALIFLSEHAAIASLPDTSISQEKMREDYDSDWEYFADNRDLQLAHFGCLPQSKWHDEYMFLYMIYATEIAFAGILASLRTLPVFAIRKDWPAATSSLKEALFFSDFLTRLWEIFGTMPVKHFFDGFRIDTGNASAIQSVRFQTLDVLSRGLGETKTRALGAQTEVRPFSSWTPPEEATLPGLVKLASEAGEVGLEFIEAAFMLDRDLYKWRSKHIGIARKYLPMEQKGTGDTEGVSYLEKNFRSPMLVSEQDGASGKKQAPQEAKFPVAVTSAFRVATKTAPLIGLIDVRQLDVSKENAALDRYLAGTLEAVTRDEAAISRRMRFYQPLFKPLPYPVERLTKEYIRSKQLPEKRGDALIAAIQVRTGLTLIVQSSTRTSGSVTVDVASEGETISTARTPLKCVRGEPVLRDKKGILASFVQGLSDRGHLVLETKEPHKRLFFFLVGYPGMPAAEMRGIMEQLTNALSEFGAQVANTWVLNE